MEAVPAPKRRRGERAVSNAEQHKNNPDPKVCDFFLPQKRRFCKFEKKVGSRFCHTHATELLESSSDACGDARRRRRVPCPLNPAHTVYERDLQRHVRVCPDGRFVASRLPFFVENLHFAHNKAAASAAVALTNGDRSGVLRCALAWHPAPCEDINSEGSPAPHRNSVAAGPDIADTVGGDASHDDNHEDGGEAASQGPSLRRSHRDLDPSQLQQLTEIINKLYEEHVVPVFLRAPQSHDNDLMAATVASEKAPEPIASEGGAAEGRGATRKQSQKHAPQHRAILAAMRRVGLAPEQMRGEGSPAGAQGDGGASAAAPCHFFGYIEMGAGKGGLALALREAHLQKLEQQEQLEQQPRFVVCDRGGFRRKAEGAVRHEVAALERWRLDIKDLHLGRAVAHTMQAATGGGSGGGEEGAGAGAAGGADASGPCRDPPPGQDVGAVVVGKHLCGACTDFAVLCATTHVELDQPGAEPAAAAAAAAAAAVVVVRGVAIATCCHHRCELQHLPLPFFGFSAEEFACVCSLSSWACCGSHAVSRAQRELGYKCKRLIDAVRLRYLVEACGFSRERSRLVEYVDRHISGENVLLLAVRG